MILLLVIVKKGWIQLLKTDFLFFFLQKNVRTGCLDTPSEVQVSSLEWARAAFFIAARRVSYIAYVGFGFGRVFIMFGAMSHLC